ncbi:hypothetical protein LJK88_17300 [Paenibacillus sp. P26]|nr:hypothetical protein LJK88_17300 [Paenibacillus sp. P26]
MCRFFTALIIHRSGVFNPDGSFNDALAYRSGHFHTRLGTLDALARYAWFTRDASILHFVKKSYDWAVSTWCTSFGWTPGDMHDQAFEHETCSLVDLIATGITLARSWVHGILGDRGAFPAQPLDGIAAAESRLGRRFGQQGK